MQHRHAIGLALLFSLLAGRGHAQQLSLASARFTPMVVDASQPVSVVLETRVSGTPSSVRLMLVATGKEVLLGDDGTTPDKAAGDGVWTVALAAADVLFNLREDDVNRHFVGFLRLYQGSTFSGQSNIFIDVLTPGTVPPVVVRALAPNAQATEHLVNIVDRAFFDSGTPPSGTAIPAVTREFYRHFGDEYDFINLIYEVPYFQNRDHFAVRNEVQGIGLGRIDNGASYGSARRLLGISRFPIPTFFDGAEAGYQHELGHQWINFLRGTPLEAGIPHWPLSDVANDIMGLSIPGSNVGGQFPYDLIPDGNDYRVVARANQPLVFSDLSLYLMGLLPPEKVQKHVVFNNQNQTPVAGQKLLGPVTMVDANDLARLLGPRVPDASQSPKSFKVATILVSRDGLVAENVMRLYEFFSARAEEQRVVPYSLGLAKGFTNPFFLSTQGLALLNARLLPAAPGTARPTLTAATRSALTGGPLRVAWNDIVVPSAADWFGLYLPNAADGGYLARWTTNGAASGSQIVTLPAGLAGDFYELRLFAGGSSQRLAASSVFSVIRMELTPSLPTVNDAPTIRLSGVWRDGCIPRNPRTMVAGNQIRITTPAVAGACITALTPWSLTAPLSPLAAGAYEVIFSYDQEVLGTGAFTVANP